MILNDDDSNGEGGGVGIDYSTARGRDWPSVRQFNVFLANRMGSSSSSSSSSRPQTCASSR